MNTPDHEPDKLPLLDILLLQLIFLETGNWPIIPEEARAMTLRYYSQPENTLKPIEDAIAFVAGFPQAELSKIAAMGYCFGGYVAVNAAKLGAPLKAVVSFHGRLVGAEAKKIFSRQRF